MTRPCAPSSRVAMPSSPCSACSDMSRSARSWRSLSAVRWWRCCVVGRASEPRRPRCCWAPISTTQILKDTILDRPDLGLGTLNSLPSGHTTVVASAVGAALLVAPGALRPLVALAGGFATTLTGASTIVAGWHRPADVMAALAVSLIWTAVVAAVIHGPRHPVARHRRRRGRGLCRWRWRSWSRWAYARSSVGTDSFRPRSCSAPSPR